jgi:hypothetical protein
MENIFQSPLKYCTALMCWIFRHSFKKLFDSITTYEMQRPDSVAWHIISMLFCFVCELLLSWLYGNCKKINKLRRNTEYNLGIPWNGCFVYCRIKDVDSDSCLQQHNHYAVNDPTAHIHIICIKKWKKGYALEKDIQLKSRRKYI